MTDYVNALNLDGRLIPLPISDLEQTFTRNVDGTVASIAVTYSTVTYVQTFIYTSGKVASISQWTAQP